MSARCPPGQAEFLFGLTPCLGIEAARDAVAVIAVLSVLAAAGFGLLGTLTDYKADGRVTFWGKVAAAGVVLTALLSLGLNSLQADVAAAESAEQRSESARQAADQRDAADKALETQLARFAELATNLQSLSGTAAATQQGVTRSVAAQQAQLDAARRLQQDLATSAGRSEANATRLLASVRRTAEQVSGQDIRLLARVDCVIESGAPSFPRFLALLGDRPSAVVPQVDLFTVEPSANLTVARLDRTTLPIEPGRRCLTSDGLCRKDPRKQYDPGFLSGPATVEPPRVAREGSRGDSWLRLSQTILFTQFGVDDRSMEIRQKWNGTFLEPTLTAGLNADAALLAGVQGPDALNKAGAAALNAQSTTFFNDREITATDDLPAAAARNYPLESFPLRIAYDDRLLPCAVNVQVHLRGTWLGSQNGRLVARETNPISGEKSGLRLVIPPIEVPADLFPDLDSPPPSEPAP